MTLLSNALALLRLSARTWRDTSGKTRALLYGVRPDGETQPLLVGSSGELLTNASGSPSGPGGEADPADVLSGDFGAEVDNNLSRLSAVLSDTLAGFEEIVVQPRGGHITFGFGNLNEAPLYGRARLLYDGQTLTLYRSRGELTRFWFRNAAADETPYLVITPYGTATPTGGGDVD